MWNHTSTIAGKDRVSVGSKGVNPLRDNKQGKLRLISARLLPGGELTMARKWNFLSNYGLVLTHLFQNSRATLREIARGTDLTERAVYQIVRDLEENGFIQKRRVGRRNIDRKSTRLNSSH